MSDRSRDLKPTEVQPLSVPDTSRTRASASATPRPSLLVRVLCRNILGSLPASEATHDPAAGPANAGGVAALLAIATDAVSDERDRGRELDSKVASLAGFSGIILSVDGLVVGSVFSHRLGSFGGPFARVCFITAIVSLLLAVLVAIAGVLMPQGYRGVGRDQVRHFTSASVQAHDELWVHQSMLGALADILEQDRPVNDCKAYLAKLVARLLAVAFIFVAGEAVTIVVQKASL